MQEANVKVIHGLSRRLHFKDAILLITALWVIMLGADLVIIAQYNLLTLPVFVADLVLVTLGVFGGWLALSGAGYLLSLPVGGRGNYQQVLKGVAVSTWPLSAIGLIVIAFNFFGTLSGLAPVWIVAWSLILLWLGLIVGVPGYCLALALRATLKIKFLQASLISLLLLSFTGVLLLWFYGQLLG